MVCGFFGVAVLELAGEVVVGVDLVTVAAPGTPSSATMWPDASAVGCAEDALGNADAGEAEVARSFLRIRIAGIAR
jgi:hypothetical protein